MLRHKIPLPYSLSLLFSNYSFIRANISSSCSRRFIEIWITSIGRGSSLIESCAKVLIFLNQWPFFLARAMNSFPIKSSSRIFLSEERMLGKAASNFTHFFTNRLLMFPFFLPLLNVIIGLHLGQLIQY